MDIILNRRSIREYAAKKIPYEDLKKLCIYGEAAPSARNQKSREYMIIDDDGLLKKLAAGPGHAQFIENAAAAIVVIGKDANSLSTPHMMIQDLSCAVENILLAATSLGVGSCYIGIYPVEERLAYYKELLHIPGADFPFALISLGYPTSLDCFYDKKKGNESLIHHNGY